MRVHISHVTLLGDDVHVALVCDIHNGQRVFVVAKANLRSINLWSLTGQTSVSVANRHFRKEKVLEVLTAIQEKGQAWRCRLLPTSKTLNDLCMGSIVNQ